MHKTSGFIVAVLIGGAVCSFAARTGAQSQSGGPPQMPPARAIPGITADDPFPRGCVDCHIDYTDMNMDKRISTLMAQWNERVAPAIVLVARAVSASSVKLTGVHPRVDAALNDIPAGCISCHRGGADDVPPLAPLLHRLHLETEGEAVFLRLFQGECTHCHKLDAMTGRWRIPSGSEQSGR